MNDERRVQLITPTGTNIAWVRLPENYPRHLPFILEWRQRFFLRSLDCLYMEVQKVEIVDVPDAPS